MACDGGLTTILAKFVDIMEGFRRHLPRAQANYSDPGSQY